LENFKSYAGVKEVGPFHKCFSAVVGPNGSGKSNVIDAMLFVFGKRAKKLRLNKVSELIHNSDSVKDNPPEFARVSVHFQEIIDTGDGDEDYVVVPNTEAVVTRVALKNNSSTYKLNGKNSSFKEIAAFLNSKGIDLDNNRFLILQGEVEMISMMAPKGKTENDEGLLEYLEDIIGSSKFVEQTNEAALKVEVLTEQRQEKLNRVKSVEKEKDNLEGAKLEAEALLGKEREIRKKQNILYQIHVMRAVEEATAFAEKKDEVVQKLEQERQTLASASSRIEELEKGLSGLRKEYDSAFSELKKTKDEFSAYERRDIKIREEIKHGRSQQTKLDGKIKTESKKETSAMSKGEAATESIPVLAKKIREISERKAKEDAELEKLYEEVKGLTQELRKELEAKTHELAPVKQERAVFQAALDTAEAEIKLLEDSTNRVKQRLVSSEEELAAVDETQNSKRLEVTRHQEGLAHANARIVAAETEENALAQREGALAQRSKELMVRITTDTMLRTRLRRYSNNLFRM
jgi:structural maintenance of chromosome 4